MLPEEESLDELARRAGQGDKEALEGICRQTAPSAYRSKARSQRARLSVPHGSWIWPRQSRSCIGPIPASLRRRGFGKRSGKLPQISSDPSDGGRASPVDRSRSDSFSAVGGVVSAETKRQDGAALLRVLAGAATAWSVVYLVVYLWVIDPQEGEIAMRGDRSAVGRRLRPRRLRDASAAPGRRVAGGVAA